LRIAFFSHSFWSAVMKNEQHADFDSASIWRAAHQRRAEDLGGWFGALPAKQIVQAKEADQPYPAAQPQPI
jgi:hypothetical protein